MNVSNLDHKIDAVIQEQWKTIDPQINAKNSAPGKNWDFSISPPFPHQWPVDESGYTHYAYLTRPGFPQGIADGQLIGMIWGQLSVVAQDGSPKLLFSKRPFDSTHYEIQGVRPLTHDETDALQISPWSALQSADHALLKRYYCTWASTNGVLFQAIAPNHRHFFQYLGC